MSDRRRPIIAIDGPAGAGKSTVARRLARRLGFQYVDTGAMYRAIALKAHRLQLAHDPEAVVRLANESRVTLEAQGEQVRVRLDDEDVTEQIRAPHISELVSALSALPGVRRRMVELQRALGENGGIVMEGRDIQTVVFPQAEVKVYLTASDRERAQRRCAELRARGIEASLDTVEAELRARDQRDSTRLDSPLAAAPDAEVMPTDGMTIDEVVERLINVTRARCPQFELGDCL